MRIFFVSIIGISLGLAIGYFVFVKHISFSHAENAKSSVTRENQVIGFLPYWLIGKNNTDYSKYITTLSYYDLVVSSEGSIEKLMNEQEEEPGWNALTSGKLDSVLTSMKEKEVNLSLLVFNGNSDTIDQLVLDPITHADNLMQDVKPVMKKYGFTDLNLDIEKTTDASDAARMNFIQFVKRIKQDLDPSQSLTVDISGADVIKKTLVDPKEMGKIADRIVLMAYDFHASDSYVTGPVSPLSGAGKTAEYDVTSALAEAMKKIPAKKIILGMPSYGYEWETIDKAPRSAVIPDTGYVASSNRAEALVNGCSSCSATFDKDAYEEFVIYHDSETGTYHQLFYPLEISTRVKLSLADASKITGVAMWALGYENKSLMNPLALYK